MFFIQTSRSTIQSYLCLLLPVVSTVPITEGRLITSNEVSIELITGRDVGRVMVLLVAVGYMMRVHMQVAWIHHAIVRVVNGRSGVARVRGGGAADTIFEVDYGWPLLINIIIIFII